MYETWWPHKKAWSLCNLAGTYSYYRTGLEQFLSQGQYLRTDIYTTAERQVHRPDLPFAFAQVESLNWNDRALDTLPLLRQELARSHATGTLHGAEKVLDTPAIYLQPFGPKGSIKPSIWTPAPNGRMFTESELLWHARRVQAAHLRDTLPTRGIGVYRSGIRKRLPSFYLWGSLSRADQHVLDHEGEDGGD